MNKVDEAIQQYLDFNGLDITTLTERLTDKKAVPPGEEEEGRGELPPTEGEGPLPPEQAPMPPTEDDAAMPGDPLPDEGEDVPNLVTPGGEQAWMDIALNAALWQARDDQVRNKVVQIQSQVNAGIIAPDNIKSEALPALLAIIGADVASAAESEVENNPATRTEMPPAYV